MLSQGILTYDRRFESLQIDRFTRDTLIEFAVFWINSHKLFIDAKTKQMIAYCGLLCDGCRIHLATLEQDKSRQLVMRTEIVTICNEKYGMNLVLADVTDCDGCCADTGRIFSGCLTCEIRKCAKQRMLVSCANCNEYPCSKLEKMFQEDPEAQVRLENIRNRS